MSMSKPLKDSSAAAANVVAESTGRGRRDDKSSMTATAGSGAGATSTNRNNARRGGGPSKKSHSSDSTKGKTVAAATGASLRVEREKGEANRPSVADSAPTGAKANTETKEPTDVAAAAVAAAIKTQEQIASLVKQIKKLKMDKDEAEEETEQHVLYLQQSIKDLRSWLFLEKQAMEKTMVAAFLTDDEKAVIGEMGIAVLPRFDLPEREEYLPASDKRNMSLHVCECEGCCARSEYPYSAFLAFFPPGNGHAKGFASPDIPLPDKARHAVIRHLREEGADMSNLPPAIPLLEPWVVSKELKSYMDRGQEGFNECILLASASRGCLPRSPECQCHPTVFFCQCEVCNNDDLENAYAVWWCSCESTCGSGGGGGDFAPYDVPLPPVIYKLVSLHVKNVGADLSKIPEAILPKRET